MTQILTNWVRKSGPLSPLVYILVQFLQVTFIPISSTPVTVLGSIMFPWWKCLLFTLLGQIAGSWLAFWIGRKFGLKAIYKFTKPQTVQKWRDKMKGREKTTLVFMFLLPVFPDDLLCLLSGLTDMRHSTFLVTQLFSRTLTALWTIFGTLLVKRMAQLNISWYVWLIIGVLAGVLMTLVVVYQDKISDTLLTLWRKINGQCKETEGDTREVRDE